MKKNRRKQRCSTFLEDLPNELFAQILSYLNGVDAVYAFARLNHRLQTSLIEHCQDFDFKSISKLKFDLVAKCKCTQRWKSLILSADEHTPDLLHHFAQTYSFTRDFPHLQAFALVNLNSRKTYGGLSELSHLSSLVSLTLKSICSEIMPRIDLPNLKKLVCSCCLHIDWLENLPQLQSLDYCTETCHWFSRDWRWPSTLRHLKITFNFDALLAHLQGSLAHLPLLTRLEIYQRQVGTPSPDGQPWERVIQTSLPQLKIFKFYFQFSTPQHLSEVQNVVASFSTPFYLLNEWYVRCDRSERYPWRMLLYSLPFPYHTYRALQGFNTQTFSTSPTAGVHDDPMQTFTNVRTLEVFYKTSMPDESFQRHAAATHLLVYNDFESTNWTHVLTKLQQVHFDHPTNLSSEHFLHLLANAPELRSLIIEKRLLQFVTNHWKHTTICQHLSRKIVSLKLCGMSQFSRSISEHEIQQLVRIFSPKCQHLSLYVQSPENSVGPILERMSRLHSLHITVSTTRYPSIDMPWVERQQTVYNQTNCVLVKEPPNFYFWLGKHA